MEPKQPHRLTPKGRATRERILALAARLMFTNGVAGTTTEDVQRSGGISPSQIYHYFGDKKSLIKAVIAYQTEAVLDTQRPLLSRLDSFEALEAWRDALIDLQRSRRCRGGCPIGSLASELADHDPEARADLATGLGRWEAAIRDGLTAMRDRGELRADADPEFLALASELADHDPEARADLATGLSRWEAAICDGLTAMRDRGELRADADPEFLALATLTAVQGGLLMTQVRHDTVALRTVLDAMIDRIRSHASA